MGIAGFRSHMKANKTDEPKARHEKAFELWFKMRKFQFKRDNTKEKKTGSRPLTSLTTSSSELSIPQPLTPKATILLYTSSDVLRAKIFLAMKCVSSHYPQRSMDEFPDLMRTMFPDSEIAWYFALGCTIVGYVINYGLKRSYQNKFMSTVKNANLFTVCFDGPFNQVSNWEQMDVHLLYFDGAENRVVR